MAHSIFFSTRAVCTSLFIILGDGLNKNQINHKTKWSAVLCALRQQNSSMSQKHRDLGEQHRIPFCDQKEIPLMENPAFGP